MDLRLNTIYLPRKLYIRLDIFRLYLHIFRLVFVLYCNIWWIYYALHKFLLNFVLLCYKRNINCCIVLFFLYLLGRFAFFSLRNFILSSPYVMQSALKLFGFDAIFRFTSQREDHTWRNVATTRMHWFCTHGLLTNQQLTFWIKKMSDILLFCFSIRINYKYFCFVF